MNKTLGRLMPRQATEVTMLLKQGGKQSRIKGWGLIPRDISFYDGETHLLCDHCASSMYQAWCCASVLVISLDCSLVDE